MTMQHFLPHELPAGLEQLTEPAFELRWSASGSAAGLWREADPELWEATRNPALILESVSHAQLQALVDNDRLMLALNSRVLVRQHSLEAPTWMESRPGRNRAGCIAYFSVEFGLPGHCPFTPAAHYRVRVIPAHPPVRWPLEAGLVYWEQ
jgi:starch phosphorylase